MFVESLKLMIKDKVPFQSREKQQQQISKNR